MGLLDFLRRLFFSASATSPAGRRTRRRRRRKVRLVPLRRDRRRAVRQTPRADEVDFSPYPFASFGVQQGGYLDLSQDGSDIRLAEFGLPVFHTPEELARWLDLPVGKVAWLIDRFSAGYRPESERTAHYHYRWLKKRSGGLRLIEAPKRTLKSVQARILTGILDSVPPHASAHGFVARRSILTNARPHVGSRVVLKFDLENFYASVRFGRVVAIFRSMGYSREAALWLSRLTTSALPPNMPFLKDDPSALLPFLRRHLPQGAPTSPALANLSAYSLDVRLSGLARSFGARYSRYADDLTFSGSQQLVRALPVFIPLVTQVIRDERFRVNRKKRKVVRNNQRQVVTGVVVNERPNISRRDYDRLKAILTNCVRHGPSTQNRESHDDFAAHLHGRIAHASHLNPARGARLLDLYRQIDWRR